MEKKCILVQRVIFEKLRYVWLYEIYEDKEWLSVGVEIKFKERHIN